MPTTNFWLSLATISSPIGALAASNGTQSTAYCGSQESAESLSISSSRPTNAVQVPGNFIGFGFETAFLNDYANAFSQNLVDSVAQRLGETVIIRIGGTSGDRLLFNPDQTEVKVCIAGDCPVGSGATYILGPSYFDGFQSFPNQHFTFQAPLGPVVNTTNSLDYVNQAYAAIGAARVDAIAIGNEPDVYARGTTDYTPLDYTDAALSLEQAIVGSLQLTSQNQIFEVGDTASGDTSNNFTIVEALQEGLDRYQNAKYIAQHWYQYSSRATTGYTPATLQSALMSHSAITSRFNQGYLQTLQYVQQNYPSATYILSETGSTLSGPPLSFSDAFGACLWAVDFNLYAMSLGVKRLDGTQRPAAPHSLWVPDTSTNSPSLGNETNIGPQVRGPYYATPMLADFLGQSSGAVVNVLGEDTLTAYALYDTYSGSLSKVALVNLNFWSADTGGERQNTTFAVPVGSGVPFVAVGYLTAEAGAYAEGYDAQGANGTITWQGETWSYDLDLGQGSFMPGVAQKTVVPVCNGVAYVDVPYTAAAIVYVS